jgi:hypothetical protein
MKKIKISNKNKENFLFLTTTHLHGIGVGVGCETQLNTDGYTALEAWVYLDTHGKKVECKEPELLDLAISGKASWNLQIKQWAEDLAEGLLIQEPEIEEYCKDYPSWIKKSTINQSKQIIKKQNG